MFSPGGHPNFLTCGHLKIPHLNLHGHSCARAFHQRVSSVGKNAKLDIASVNRGKLPFVPNLTVLKTQQDFPSLCFYWNILNFPLGCYPTRRDVMRRF
jgi:hypothetical protein